jgi:alpha-ketoglutarate-dependent taurine dioxygenase
MIPVGPQWQAPVSIHPIPEARVSGDRGAVRERSLRPDERPYPSGDATMPRVFEPTSDADPRALHRLLAEEWPRMRAALDEHGAILLRDFACRTAADFEEALGEVAALSPLRGYLMREPGRERVPGTRAVFETNTRFRTGGGVEFGGFHTENYYSLDIPSVQAFFCRRAPWFGGETAVVRVRRGLAPLDDALWERLEAAPFPTCTVELADIAARYGLGEAAVERLLRDARVPLRTRARGVALVISKPSVFRNPRTGASTLQANVSRALPGLTDALIARFRSRYSGPRWIAHRHAWRHPAARLALRYLEHLPRFARVPGLARRQLDLTLGALWPRKASSPDAASGARPARDVGLAGAFTEADMHALADAIYAGISCFRWRRGDVLLLDSTQTLHAGMPGFGPRDLAVMMFNPVPLPHPLVSGVLDLETDREGSERYVSFDERLVRLAERSCGAR